MRILQVADFYWPHLGGVEQHVRTLSASLAAADHDVHVATLRTGDLPADDRDGDVAVHRISSTVGRVGRLFSSAERPWAPPLPDPEAVVALGRLVAELRPHIVHGHDWLARSYLPLARWARRRHGTRFVTSQHYYTLSCAKKDLIDATASERNGRSTPCAGPSPRRCTSCAITHYGRAQGLVTLAGSAIGARAEVTAADAIVAVSRATAVGNGLDPRDVDIIGNPVADPMPADAHDELLRQLPGSFVLFVGDLRPMKGLDVLFAAFRELRRRIPDSPPLVVIGKRWPDTPGDVPDGVMMFERWPNAAVLAAWERATVGVVPSVWAEPFGIVAIEALRGGTPLVVARSGGLVEIVRDGVEGLTVPPSDPHALAEALGRMLTDDAQRAHMAAAARERANDFTADAIRDAVVSVYERVSTPVTR